MALSSYRMITIPEAVSIVLEHTQVLPAVELETVKALGLVLAEAVVAADPIPPFPASIKDGYAVRSADGAGEFTVIGESRAGHMDEITLIPGTVAYITTGAPVPPGADAVVQVENTAKLDSVDGVKRVKILTAAKPGLDIRPLGSDIRQGEVVLGPGEVVGVAEVGILASVGATSVRVQGRPLLAVLSTGDEVVEPATRDLRPGQIRDANRSMLLAAAAKAGAVVLDLGIARDTEGHLEACLDKAIASGVDVLVTSGGVSMGDRDLIKPLLERSGHVHFGKVKMKPGKPLTFATIDLPDGRRMLVFGLPGNPVSSFVCFHLVVLPALRRMMGWATASLRRVHVTTTSDIKLDPERPEYHRASVQYVGTGHSSGATGWIAMSTGNQISSRLLSARSANALLELPQEWQGGSMVPAGTVVSALLIDDLGCMPVPEDGVAKTPGFL